MTQDSRSSRRSAAPVVTLLLGAAALVLSGCHSHSDHDMHAHEGAGGQPHVMAGSAVEAGRYLAIVASCNDCHTEGYLQQDGQIPEENWLAGSTIGWRGPWGTTYASNLRLSVQDMSEDDWVLTMHERDALPPMPWMNTKQMSEHDARAIYRYIVSLGPRGTAMPRPLPPDTEPETPYFLLEPQNLEPQSLEPEAGDEPAG